MFWRNIRAQRTHIRVDHYNVSILISENKLSIASRESSDKPIGLSVTYVDVTCICVSVVVLVLHLYKNLHSIFSNIPL